MAILFNINGLFAIDSTGAMELGGAAGASTYVLMSNGAGSANSWYDVQSKFAEYLPLTGGTLTGNLALTDATNNPSLVISTGSLTVGGVTILNDHLKVFNAWSSSDLTQNSFYAQNATDGFAFGVGSDVSTWFSYDSTTGIGVKPAIHVYNNASEIKIGVSDQPITMVGVTTFNANIAGTTGSFSGLVSGITPTAAANFATKAYVDGIGGGVSKIIASTNITISPVTGLGDVTISATDTNTTYSAGNGITFTGTPATTINADINYISYDGSNNFIESASNLLGSSIGTQAKICYVAPGNLKIVSFGDVGDLPFTNNTGDLTSITLGNGLTGSSLTGPIPNILMSGTYTGTFNITDDLNVTDSARFEGTTNPITIGDGFGYGGSATICKHNTDLYLQYNNGQTATNLQIGGGGTAVTIKDAQNGGFQITGNSTTYFTGGNVGIGETSPDQKLNVREDGGSDVFRGIEVHNNDQSQARAGICFKAYDWVQSAIWHGRSSTAAYAGALVLGTNPNTSDLTVSGVTGRMWILNNGNVGIGTNSPFGSATNEGLNVDKGGHSSIMIGDGVNDGGMIQSSDNSRRIIIGANVYDSPTASWARFNASGAALVDVYGEGTAPFISLNVDAGTTGYPTPRLFIKSNGYVGIGTTTPDTTLHVQTNAVPGVSHTYYGSLIVENNGESAIDIVGTSYSSIYFADAASPYAGGIVYNHSLNALDFRVNTNTNAMWIDSGGDVGIGMTAPASKLQFSSNNHAADAGSKNYTGSAINADGGDIATGRILLQGYQNGATDLCGINNETSRVVLYNYTDNRYLQIWDQAGNSYIPNGALGIGNTSTSYNLDVSGTGRFTNKLYAYSLDTRNVPNSTWAYVLTTATGSNSNDSGFWVNSDGSPDMRLRRLDGTVRTLFNSNTSDSYINNGGSLGIGNNAPGYKLDVTGTGNFSSYLKLANAWSASTLSANSFYAQNATDGFAMGIGTGISSWFSWSNTAGQKRAIDLDNDGNYILVGAGGQNVQINGTTTPLAPLSVDNNAIRMGRDWAIANRANIRLDSNGPSNPADILYGHTAAANEGSWTGVYWSLSSRGSSASNRFYFYRGGGNPTGGSEAVIMSFDPNLRVGINQVAPAYALDVTGVIRATSDILAYSDARVKDNVKTIDNALKKVTKLRGVSYTRNDIEDRSTKIGVIAQEILKVVPEVVNKDSEGKYSVSYGNIVGVLIEAIKELEARVKELENK